MRVLCMPHMRLSLLLLQKRTKKGLQFCSAVSAALSERHPVPRLIPHSPKAFFRHLHAHFGRHGRREPAAVQIGDRGIWPEEAQNSKTIFVLRKGHEQILVCVHVGIRSLKNSCTDHTPAYVPLSEREVDRGRTFFRDGPF